VGKAGTFALMTAYPLFLAGHGPATWQTVLHVAAWCRPHRLALAWIAAAFLRPGRPQGPGGRAPARHDSDDEGIDLMKAVIMAGERARACAP